LAVVHMAMSLHKKALVGFAFIDDTNLCVSSLTLQATTIATQIQQAVTNWEGLLHAMGGALVLDKCFRYLIDQKWMQGKWQYCMTQQVLATLVVANAQGWKLQIPCLEPLET